MGTRNEMALVEERGVYWARYTKGGRPICFAVDSRGEIVRRYVVTHDALAQAAVNSLWSYLDVVDPVPMKKPSLQLIRPRPSSQRSVDEFDPYNPLPLPGAWRRPL